MQMERLYGKVERCFDLAQREVGEGNIAERRRLVEAVSLRPTERERPIIAIQRLSSVTQDAMNRTDEIERLCFTQSVAYCPPFRKRLFKFLKGFAVRFCFSLSAQPLPFVQKSIRRDTLMIFRQGVS